MSAKHKSTGYNCNLQKCRSSPPGTRSSFINPFDSSTMASSIKSIHPFKEIICDRLYDAYDPCLLLSSVSDSQSAFFSPSEDQSKLFVNLKSSLIGFTLEQFPNFPNIVQRVASIYSPTGKAVLDDKHSHVIFKVTLEVIRVSLGLS